MIRIIRSVNSEFQEGFIAAKLATLDSDRNAITLAINVETDDIAQYVAANAAALESQILAEGKIDDRLTAKFRARDAKRLLNQSILDGKSLSQVESYIDDNITNLASAKAVIRLMAGQIWMLYQVTEFLMDDR